MEQDLQRRASDTRTKPKKGGLPYGRRKTDRRSSSSLAALVARKNPKNTPNVSANQAPNFAIDDILKALDLFFDTLMNNPDVPTSAQSLVGRLQIPIVKAAVANPQFLIDAHHPARRLVKLIVKVCSEIDSDDTQYNSVYQNMLGVVSGVVRQFESDERVFLKAYFEIKQLLLLDRM